MMRTAVILLVLLAACSSSPDKSTPQAATAPKRPPMDTLCFNDCLGAGTSREFCENRCSY